MDGGRTLAVRGATAEGTSTMKGDGGTCAALLDIDWASMDV